MRFAFGFRAQLRRAVAVAGALTVLAGVSVTPAFADPWDRDDWRRREWREHEWREHEWREHQRPYAYYYGAPGYYAAPSYVYPPPVYYAPSPPPPPPVVYGAPSLNFGFSFR
jgi:hypothetical protein